MAGIADMMLRINDEKIESRRPHGATLLPQRASRSLDDRSGKLKSTNVTKRKNALARSTRMRAS